jgi:hypothetical protein
LEASERTVSTAGRTEAVALLQAIVRVLETANELLINLDETARDLLDKIFGSEVMNGIAQTA